MELPYAQQHHRREALHIWQHRVPDTRTALLPPTTGHPNPLVVGDLLVASVFAPGTVYAVDKDSGRPQWAHKMDAYGDSCVIHAGDRIYAKSSRTLYCLDAASGREHWRFSPTLRGRETIYSSPTVHQGRVFIGDRAGMFHCLDALTGEPRWAHQVSTGKNNQVNATAAIHDDIVAIGSNEALVVAHDVLTGQERWRQSIDGPCSTELGSHDGEVFARTTGSIYAFDASAGALRFKKSWPQMDVHAWTRCRDSQLAVVKPAGRSGDQPPQLIAFNGDADRFQIATAEFIVGIRFHPPSDLVYESRLDGLGIVDPSTGRRLHDVHSDDEMFGVGLVDIEAGRIYAMSMDGWIYCLRSPVA